MYSCEARSDWNEEKVLWFKIFENLGLIGECCNPRLDVDDVLVRGCGAV